MPAFTRKRDIVEEFWDAETLAACRDEATGGAVDGFVDDLRAFLGAAGAIWPTPSGRDALRQLLAGCRSDAQRTVLACSFNCRVVPEAAIRAGCRVETFDFADARGRFDWASVADRIADRHCAVVVPHFFGVPTDFSALRTAAERAGAIVIEDAAHALGARIGTSAAGTLGDAAIFSFNYDKPISLGGGGALLVNNADLSRRLSIRVRTVTLDRDERELGEFLAYLRRRRGEDRSADGTSGRPWSTPVSYLRDFGRRTGLRPLFAVSGIGPLRAALGRWQLRAYPSVLRQRNANAEYFAASTGSSWHIDPGVAPAWLKQKATPARAGDAPRISAELRRLGVPVGTFNWSRTIDRYVRSEERPHARHVAAYGLDIPIHQNLERRELDLVCDVFNGKWSRTASASGFA
jgi:dTDP-4-amino-4,6-dideoxygalactose transaminase